MSAAPEPGDGLGDLRALWQQAIPGHLSTQVDAAALRATLRRRRNYMRLMMALDIAGVVAIAVVAVWITLTLPTVKWVVWAVFVTALGVGTLLASIRIRRPLWSVDLDAGVDRMVDTAVRQVRAAVAVARLTCAVVAVAFLFLIPFGIYDLAGADGLAPEALRRRWFAYGFALLYGLTFVFIALRLAAAKRRELARWEALAESLAGGRAARAADGPAQGPASSK